MTSIAKEHLSTGEAAALCSVTPDTVLKWIRAGKIPAHRTPGGHHRIPRSVLLHLLHNDNPPITSDRITSSYQYCWEYYSDSGVIPDGCLDCIVFRSKSRRCYEMIGLPSEAGHVGQFCKGTCEDCDYFKTVQGQRPNVLIVTDRDALRVSLKRDSKGLGFNLRFADCEYRCSMAIEQFRPDYVVVDCSMGAKRSRDFATLLHEDPRIPFVRIVLVANGARIPSECGKLVYAMVDRHFTAKTLSNLMERHSRGNLSSDRRDTSWPGDALE